MMRMKVFALLSGAGLAFCLLGVQAAEAATVTYVGMYADQTDYSPTGLNLGTAGYWFPNFAAASPVTGEAVDSNHRNALPSWFTPDFNPLNVGTYSFDPTAATTGGQPDYDVLTLPNGETGISGELVDVGHPNSANNTIPRIVFGSGVPSTFYVHFVVDNDNGDHSLLRLRARGFEGSQSQAQLEPLPVPNNQTADVYTFRYDGYVVGSFLTLQLKGDLVNTIPLTGGIGGIMLDLNYVVPEPTSALLLTLGAMSLSVVGRRRKQKSRFRRN